MRNHPCTLLPILGLLILVIFLGAGCVRIAYLPTDERVRYASSNDIEIFWEEPKRPYKIIGRISASSGDFGEEEIFRRLKQRAADEGGHAIIMGGSTQSSSVIGAPLATGGTLILPVTKRQLEALVIRWNDKE